MRGKLPRAIPPLCTAAAVVLMALPQSVSLTFAPGPDERLVRTYSYFSLMPFGYAKFFPLLAALATCAALLLMLLRAVFRRLRFRSALPVVSSLAAGLSLLALIFERNTVGFALAIALLLAASAVMQWVFLLKESGSGE